MNVSATPRRLHPLVAGAATAVIVMSLVGAAAIAGLLPFAMSQKAADPPPVAGSTRTNQAGVCANCGVVASIRSVELRGDASGVGAFAGGVTGALLGNQMGRGHGNTAMTVIGAAGGALAGNEIEKSMKKRYAYRITVHMEDGTYRTVSQSSPPAVTVGEKVRVVDSTLVRA